LEKEQDSKTTNHPFYTHFECPVRECKQSEWKIKKINKNSDDTYRRKNQ